MANVNFEDKEKDAEGARGEFRAEDANEIKFIINYNDQTTQTTFSQVFTGINQLYQFLTQEANVRSQQVSSKASRNGDVLRGEYTIINSSDLERGVGLKEFGITVFDNSDEAKGYRSISIDCSHATNRIGDIVIYYDIDQNYLAIGKNYISHGIGELGESLQETKIAFAPPTKINLQTYQDDSGLIALTKNLGSEIITSAIKANLSNAANWNVNKDYIGPAIPGQKPGDFYKDSTYFYFMYNGTTPIRILRN